jgi:site-specific DNA-cytosine methylase
MIVVSLFDGISGAQVALKKLNIFPEYYYASEIEKNSIKITQNNFPNTIQLGDVTKLDVSNIKRPVDLLIWGSPCQDLSFAGSGLGLKGNKSKLFYNAIYIPAIKAQIFFNGKCGND